jgi:hypothetical protein
MSAPKKRKMTPREELMAKIHLCSKVLATNVEYSSDCEKLEAVINFCEPLYERVKALPVDAASVSKPDFEAIRQDFNVFMNEHGLYE